MRRNKFGFGDDETTEVVGPAVIVASSTVPAPTPAGQLTTAQQFTTLDAIPVASGPMTPTVVAPTSAVVATTILSPSTATPLTPDQQAYLASYTAQIAQFQAQLAQLLPVLTKAQADFATAQFKVQTDQYNLTSLINQWITAIQGLPSLVGYNYIGQFTEGAISRLGSEYQGSTPGTFTNNTQNLNAFKNYISTAPGMGQQYLVATEMSASTGLTDQQLTDILNAMPSGLPSANSQAETDFQAQSTANNTLQAYTNQQSSLQSQIEAFLASAQSYQNIIGTIPSYSDLVAAATAPPPNPIAVSQAQLSPTTSTTPATVAVSASNPILLYAGLGLLALFLLTRKAK